MVATDRDGSMCSVPYVCFTANDSQYLVSWLGSCLNAKGKNAIKQPNHQIPFMSVFLWYLSDVKCLELFLCKFSFFPPKSVAIY